METVNISLTSQQVKLIDLFINRFNFANRSEFFRALLRFVAVKPQAIVETEKIMFEVPDTRSVKTIISSMKATNKYSDQFLASLKRGLLESGSFEP